MINQKLRNEIVSLHSKKYRAVFLYEFFLVSNFYAQILGIDFLSSKPSVSGHKVVDFSPNTT